MTLYVDTSALVKLLVAEPETETFRELLSRHERVVTSALSHVELLRVAHRIGPDCVPAATKILDSLYLISLSNPIIWAAGNLLPGSALRSLDAIHLAAAASMPDLAAVCTYDERMRFAADHLGLHVVAPGAAGLAT